MSFQDVSFSRPRNASVAPQISGGPAGGGGRAATSSSTANEPLAQVSEALLQYQRNVGILENIVGSLTVPVAASSSSRAASASMSSELHAQYAAQVDVLEHLAHKALLLLEKAPTTTAKTKLLRDFERVQARSEALQERVKRFQKATAATTTTVTSAGGATSGAVVAEPEYYQQLQVQLQQDRLAEEIMREREEEIRNINRGMHQVNEIYKDLAHIVGSQQDDIDTIEVQMEESRANAESGLKQVEKANEKYGSSNCVIS